MRILLLSDFYPPYRGGVEHHVETLAAGLTERGHRVAVATLAADRSSVGVDVRNGVRIHRVSGALQRIPGLHSAADRPWAPPIPDPGLVAALRRVIAVERPDVAHGHDWFARSALPVLRDVPLVTTLHYYSQSCAKKNLLRNGRACEGPSPRACSACAAGHYGRLKGPVVLAGSALGARWERRRSRRTIAVSSSCAAGNGWDPAAVDLIPNAVPVGTQAATVDGLPDGEFLLYAGDLRPEKGVDVLLDAHRRLDPRPELVLIGGGETPLAAAPEVTALGERPHAEVVAAMAAARFVVVPSIWAEPFGLVVVEALAAGTPVIASASGGITDIVEDGGNGLLVPPGDPAALADACRRLLADDRLLDNLRAAARPSVGPFDVDRIVGAIEEVYVEVSATGTPS